MLFNLQPFFKIDPFLPTHRPQNIQKKLKIQTQNTQENLRKQPKSAEQTTIGGAKATSRTLLTNISHYTKCGEIDVSPLAT
jgi:hypothetical protein